MTVHMNLHSLIHSSVGVLIKWAIYIVYGCFRKIILYEPEYSISVSINLEAEIYFEIVCLEPLEMLYLALSSQPIQKGL